jgi:hypothetical protein
LLEVKDVKFDSRDDGPFEIGAKPQHKRFALATIIVGAKASHD